MEETREDCGRGSCPVMHLDAPERWCRACLLRTVELTKQLLEPRHWQSVSREYR